MKYKITVQQIIREDHEMILEGKSLMATFDEALRLIASRNKIITRGQFHIKKIESKE